ncbi:MAG: hypothetical protein MSS84_07950 [Bacteroidales bacterium]|nr:hypothetical protein [Bacteroidales bacterium]
MGLLAKVMDVVVGESTKEDIDHKINYLMSCKRGTKDASRKAYYQSQIDSLRTKKKYMK